MRKRKSEGSLHLGPIFRALHRPLTITLMTMIIAPALSYAQGTDAPPPQELDAPDSQQQEQEAPVDLQERDAQAAQRLAQGADAQATRPKLNKTGAELRAPIKASLRQKIELPGDLKVGTPLTLELQITHDPKVTVMLPSETGSQRWAIVEAKQETTGAEGGEQMTTAQLRMVILRPGSTTLKPMVITLLRDDGQRHELLTEPIEAKPLTSLPQGGEIELEAPQAPVSVMVEDYRPLWVALGAGALLLTALFTFLIMRRRLRQEPPAPPAPLPHVLAMEALSELAATDLLERQEFLPFYSRQSEIVREFLGRQFHFPGTELTTREIRDRLEAQDWPKALSVEDVLSWLGHCDKVKFTEDKPTVPQAEGALRQAFSIVELTRSHQEKLAQEAAKAAEEQAAAAAAKAAPQTALKLVAQTPAESKAAPAAEPSTTTVDEYKAPTTSEVEATAPEQAVTQAQAQDEDQDEQPHEARAQEPLATRPAVQLSTQGLDSWERILADAEARDASEPEDEDEDEDHSPARPQEAP